MRNILGDRFVDSCPPSTRSATVRMIRELIDDHSSLMDCFIRQAIHEFAREVSTADPPAPTGTMADGMWPAWARCAEQVLAKLDRG